MDCIDFISKIKQNSGLLVNFFDSTMALYNLMGRYEGLVITNNSTAAEIKFTVDGDPKDLEEVIQYINTIQISCYGIFQCNAVMEGSSMIITLTEI